MSDLRKVVTSWEDKDILLMPGFSLSVSIVIGLVFGWIFYPDHIPAFSVIFTLSREIIFFFQKRHIDRNSKRGQLKILRQFATDKLGLARVMVRKKNDASLIHCLVVLEGIVTNISNCCDIHDHKVRFRKVKGLLSSTKTTFDAATIDSTIVKPYGDAVYCISTIETYLNDL